MPRALNDYRLLGRSGLRVSPLCLGTMTFGEDWGWGAPKDTALKILDAYAAAGGNFIDTANVYTNSTAESFLGDLLLNRRDQFVLTTKFSMATHPGDPNSAGNHRKSLHRALDASLKRLKTDYIDLLWLHAWDQLTPVEETMRALDDTVRSGKILYVGVSDMPAWKVAQSNTLATLRGWSPYIALQIEYSLTERTPERELIPMALDLGIGVTPWSPLSAGALTGKYRNKPVVTMTAPQGVSVPAAVENRLEIGGDFAKKNLDPRHNAVVDTVLAIAQEIDRSPAQVALNWVLQQPGVTSPIIGARKLEQLQDNLKSLEFDLTSDQLARLDAASKVELGFPHDFLNTSTIRFMSTGGAKVTR